MTAPTPFVRLFLVVILVVLVGGCRQPEGEVPQPAEGEPANKTADISRDLLNVASKSPGAVEDLSEDLFNLNGLAVPAPLMDETAQRFQRALADKPLNEEQARKLATHLFVARSARELSGRQIESLKTDVTATLASVGADASAAAAVGETIEEIQASVTTNRRRWWHMR